MTVRAAAAEAGVTVALLRYRLPDTFDHLRLHIAKLRSKRTNEGFESRCERARALARTMFAESVQVTRAQIEARMSLHGLHIRCPRVRGAMREELRQLQIAKLDEFADGRPRPVGAPEDEG